MDHLENKITYQAPVSKAVSVCVQQFLGMSEADVFCCGGERCVRRV